MAKADSVSTVAGNRSKVPAHGISFHEALRVWAKVAALSFGGPGQNFVFPWKDGLFFEL